MYRASVTLKPVPYSKDEVSGNIPGAFYREKSIIVSSETKEGSRLLTLDPDHPVVSVGRTSRNSKDRVPSKNNAYFENPVVSRKHAQIILQNGKKVVIEDTGSLHGTLVDNRRLSAKEVVELRNGSEVTLGSAVFREAEKTVHYPLTFHCSIEYSPFRQPGYGLSTADLVISELTDDDESMNNTKTGKSHDISTMNPVNAVIDLDEPTITEARVNGCTSRNSSVWESFLSGNRRFSVEENPKEKIEITIEDDEEPGKNGESSSERSLRAEPQSESIDLSTPHEDVDFDDSDLAESGEDVTCRHSRHSSEDEVAMESHVVSEDESFANHEGEGSVPLSEADVELDNEVSSEEEGESSTVRFDVEKSKTTYDGHKIPTPVLTPRKENSGYHMPLIDRNADSIEHGTTDDCISAAPVTPPSSIKRMLTPKVLHEGIDAVFQKASSVSHITPTKVLTRGNQTSVEFLASLKGSFSTEQRASKEVAMNAMGSPETVSNLNAGERASVVQFTASMNKKRDETRTLSSTENGEQSKLPVGAIASDSRPRLKPFPPSLRVLTSSPNTVLPIDQLPLHSELIKGSRDTSEEPGCNKRKHSAGDKEVFGEQTLRRSFTGDVTKATNKEFPLSGTSQAVEDKATCTAQDDILLGDVDNISEERPLKRARRERPFGAFAVGTVVGALVGGVGMFAALVATAPPV